MTQINPLLKFFLSLVALWQLSALSVQAQLEMVPLEQAAPLAKKKVAGSTLRTSATMDTLQTLPFWDDFSSSRENGSPDTLLWIDSEHVSITRHIAVRPPSIGVATFDGATATGRPHSQDNNLSGSYDSLHSAPINLGATTIPENEQQQVFLSFYWQVQGRGERPERGDSLRLYFLDSDTVYHKIWPSSRNPVTANADSASFYRVAISLQEEGERFNTNFLHEGFRFLFTSEGRLSGPFDLWHLDYVYLDNKPVSIDRFYAEDRTLSEYQASLLKPYTAVPIEQFMASPLSYIDSSFQVTAFNAGYNNPAAAAGTNAFFHLNVYANGEHLHEISPRISFPRDKKGQEYYDSLFSRNAPLFPPDILNPYAGLDSINLRTVVVIEDEEPVDEHGNPTTPIPERFFVNDTANIHNLLHDYFAYDDGTAEFGIALRGNRARLAYEFTLAVQDTLTHIDMHLPYYTESIDGQYARIGVWKSLSMEVGGEDDLITSSTVSLRNSRGLNTFDSYPFANPIVLQPGTYYFGIEKEGTRTITFGFDRNNNSSGKVFVSTDLQSWSETLEEKGALMIRPRFAQKVDPLTLSLKEHVNNYPVKIFPNPNDGYFVIESEAHYIQLFNSQGQLVHAVSPEPGTTRQEISLPGLQAGLYLIKLGYKDGVISRKVLIKN